MADKQNNNNHNDSSSSSINSAANHNRWIDRLQEKQEKLAENRAELRRIIEYQRQVGTDEKKKATLAGILAAESGVPGDEWRARLAESERHQQYVTRGSAQQQQSRSRSSSPPAQQQQQQRPSSSSARPSSSVTFHHPAPSTTAGENPSMMMMPNQQQQSSSKQPQQQQSSSSYYPYSSQEEATRRHADARTAAEQEAALRIKLAKDHVAYVDAVHQREDNIRHKSQDTRETALLNEVIAARNECRRHVSENEMSARNQEDLMRVVAALKKQLSETTRELEYARKEIDFTGRECQVKHGEVTDVRVELALLRKANEKLEQKLQKRENLIVQLEREKADVLLDCKKLIRDKQEADDRCTKMTTEFNDQKRQFEDFRRESAVAPHFRAGAPSPMVFEAHRRVSPSHHSRENNNNNYNGSQKSSTNNAYSNSSNTNNSRSRSPYIGGARNVNNIINSKNSAVSSSAADCASVNKKDLELLLRDLYADLCSCSLLRRAVCWDSARAGPQVLPVWFDRAMWENVKRKAGLTDNSSVPTTKHSSASGSSKSKNATVASSSRQQQSTRNQQQQQQETEDDDEEENEQQPFPYNSYQEYKRAKKLAKQQQQHQSNNTLRVVSPATAPGETTCRRCGHAHHCHHRCQFCTGQVAVNNVSNNFLHPNGNHQQHDRSERAHVVRTKSPLKSALKEDKNLPPKTAVVVSSGAEASDERDYDDVNNTSENKNNNNNELFVQNAQAAQKRLDKIAAKLDNNGEDPSPQKKTTRNAAGDDTNDENRINDDDYAEDDHAVSSMTASQQRQQSHQNQNDHQNREASSQSTATSFGISRPFKQYVASADELAREARRGNRFVTKQ